MIESTVSGGTEDASNGSKTAGIDVTSAIQSEKVSYMFQYVTTFSGESNVLGKSGCVF